MKVIHQRLADIQDTHSTIDGFVKDQLRSLHVNRDEIFIEDGQMFEIRSRRELLSRLPVIDQSHINSVSDVLHRFSKYRIIHQLKEIFLKAVLRSLPELRVLLNVTFQPRFLIESDSSSNTLQFHSQ